MRDLLAICSATIFAATRLASCSQVARTRPAKLLLMSCQEPHLLSISTFLLSNATGWDGQARHELRRLLPGATVESLFLRGNIIVRSPEPVMTVLDRLREADTYYLGHIIPVQVRVAIGPGAG